MSESSVRVLCGETLTGREKSGCFHFGTYHLTIELFKKATISILETVQKAFGEYDEFNKTQEIESDFDREIKKISGYVGKE